MTVNLSQGAYLLRLETFGGARLIHENEPPAQQRRRIALFALLAVAGDRGITREKLVGYLWPESTMANARHSLEQLIYGVRRTYGDDILSKGNPVTLTPQFSSDVQEFEHAVARQDLERAASLYRGPFLDGFYLPDAPEFERWSTVEAQRFAETAATLLKQLAEAADARQDHAKQINWLRKRVALDPFSAHATVHLMHALARSGDATSAIQLAATYERLVRQELASEPDAAVTGLAAQLRERGTEFVDVVKPRSAPHPPAREVDNEVPSVSPITPAVATPRRSRWPFLAAFASLVVVVVVFLASNREAPNTRSRVAVLPFRTSLGDSSLSYLGEGVMDLLASRFTGEGGPESVEPRVTIKAVRNRSTNEPRRYADIGRITGASEIIDGEIVQTGSRDLTLSARVFEARTGKVIASASSIGSVDSLATLVDQLANRLLAVRAGESAPRIATFARSSPSAVAAFLQGRAEYRRGKVAHARELFVKALEHDSTFAAAALELALATGKLFQWNTVAADTVRRTRGITMGGVGNTMDFMQWERGLELAIRDSMQLSQRDRILLTAVRGGFPRRGIAAREILRNWENATQALPELPDTHFWLGHVLLFQGPAMGFKDARNRARSEFQRALSIDPDYAPALRGLMEIAAFDRNLDALDSLRSRYDVIDPSSDEGTYAAWRVASVRGDSLARSRLRKSFPSLGSEVLSRIRLIAQLEAEALEDAEVANSILLSRTGSGAERQLALHSTRQLNLNRGRTQDAVRTATLKREVEPNSDLQHGYAIRDALFWDGDTITAASAARAFESYLAVADNKPDDRRTSYIRFSLALWRIARGDTTSIADDIARMRGSTFARDGRADVIDALLADRIGRSDADKLLSRVDSLCELGFAATPHIINLVSARIHERRGNKSAALAAIRRGRWYLPPENLSTYLREEGRLALAIGDSAAAADAWTRYLKLRAAPDFRLRAQRDSIRRKLATFPPVRVNRAQKS